MIDAYLNQRVRYKAPTGENDYSETEYADPIVLPARVEERERRVVGVGGVEVTTTTIVYLGEEIVVGGALNTTDSSEENYRTIQGRETEGPDIGGNVYGWKALL